MTTFLLDANVLISLTAREHVHHERATRWAMGVDSFAVCPIVESALIRFALRLGATAAEALESLRLIRERPGYEFWPDTLSYSRVQLDRVRGHRHVTDAYLASVAASRPNALLATMDEALARSMPKATLLLP
ncbi:PIN domain-containing protein [Pseudactinotalea sp. HY160]|uniref:TA system VapC family ribonuclease toxin n=1 Tax=Pseudactinotalea sp. HY160 TaxID=2654490 RepID=UPI001311EFE7|nr:PIN domain-containing protein [Pseudactinotalea sp. HY160]